MVLFRNLVLRGHFITSLKAIFATIFGYHAIHPAIFMSLG